MTLDIIWAYERLNDSITAWVYVYRDGEIQFASHAGYHDGEFAAEWACIEAAEGMARVARICGATANVKELGA